MQLQHIAPRSANLFLCRFATIWQIKSPTDHISKNRKNIIVLRTESHVVTVEMANITVAFGGFWEIFAKWLETNFLELGLR